MASREELLQSIQPDMKLDKDFFLKVYGFEISYPGFSKTAIKALEDAGCSKARSYYEQITTEYEKQYREKLLETSKWYSKELAQKWDKLEKESDTNADNGKTQFLDGLPQDW